MRYNFGLFYFTVSQIVHKRAFVHVWAQNLACIEIWHFYGENQMAKEWVGLNPKFRSQTIINRLPVPTNGPAQRKKTIPFFCGSRPPECMQFAYTIENRFSLWFSMKIEILWNKKCLSHRDLWEYVKKFEFPSFEEIFR